MLNIDVWKFRQVDIRNGWWVLLYTRCDTQCCRKITDRDGLEIHHTERKPIGQELVDTVERIIGRKLVIAESETLLTEVPIVK